MHYCIAAGGLKTQKTGQHISCTRNRAGPCRPVRVRSGSGPGRHAPGSVGVSDEVLLAFALNLSSAAMPSRPSRWRQPAHPSPAHADIFLQTARCWLSFQCTLVLVHRFIRSFMLRVTFTAAFLQAHISLLPMADRCNRSYIRGLSSVGAFSGGDSAALISASAQISNPSWSKIAAGPPASRMIKLPVGRLSKSAKSGLAAIQPHLANRTAMLCRGIAADGALSSAGPDVPAGILHRLSGSRLVLNKYAGFAILPGGERHSRVRLGQLAIDG